MPQMRCRSYLMLGTESHLCIFMRNNFMFLNTAIFAVGVSIFVFFALRKRGRRVTLFMVIVTVIVLLHLFQISYVHSSTFLLNKWSLWVSRGYFIPYESSPCRFKSIIQNEGSGEWWLYGEDEVYYYYAGDGVSPHRYVTIKKIDATQCSHFSPTKFDTWCMRNQPAENR